MDGPLTPDLCNLVARLIWVIEHTSNEPGDQVAFEAKEYLRQHGLMPLARAGNPPPHGERIAPMALDLGSLVAS